MTNPRTHADFRSRIDPAHAWIVGRLGTTATRLDVISALPAEPREVQPGPAPFDAGECVCPDPCPHDHANE